MSTPNLTFAGLFPHPPILVPAVAGDRIEECRLSFDGAQQFAERLVAHQPQRLFMISPHSPRQDKAFGLWSGPRLRGDLSRFGAPEETVDLPNDLPMLGGIRRLAQSEGLATWDIPTEPLDHGAVIPLWFLVQAGWRGPTAIASLPWPYDRQELEHFGRIIARCSEDLDQPYALVASGDMTHRALPRAPAGFHPRAVEFDQALCRLVRQGRLDEISRIDPELRQLAAEDAADTSIIVSAACDFEARGCEVLSYEHPFGVGYLVAVFYDQQHAVPAPLDASMDSA